LAAVDLSFVLTLVSEKNLAVEGGRHRSPDRLHSRKVMTPPLRPRPRRAPVQLQEFPSPITGAGSRDILRSRRSGSGIAAGHRRSPRAGRRADSSTAEPALPRRPAKPVEPALPGGPLRSRGAGATRRAAFFFSFSLGEGELLRRKPHSQRSELSTTESSNEAQHDKRAAGYDAIAWGDRGLRRRRGSTNWLYFRRFSPALC